ncbi:AAA family ATPase [Bacillus piscicola]|uniref:AAA family ATPase n=1 Tax=Bacillus piscicola TaxID=1632684 RepID=UPI001F09FCF6
MSIICIEGPPAVGKTTVAYELADRYGFYVVPAAETYWSGKEKDRSWLGQYELQVERWELALRKTAEYAAVILDGDIFHPLLACALQDCSFQQTIYRAYQQAFTEKRIGLPDGYYYLYAGTSTLRKRLIKDVARRSIIHQEAFYDRHRNYYRHIPGRTWAIHAAASERQVAQQVIKQLPEQKEDYYKLSTFRYIQKQLQQPNR